MMRGVRVHVRDTVFPDRLLCGRQDTGQKTLPLAAATCQAELCDKCRQRLGIAESQEWLIHQPRPAGYQYQFVF
jgi:hypothetical protein